MLGAVVPFGGVAAWLLGRYGRRLSNTARVALVWIVGIAYLSLVGILTWQARRGQSIIHPDMRTLTAAGARAVRLGPTVLRSSTAGVVAAAVILSRTSRWT